MIPMKMIMRVDQARANVDVGQIELEVEMPLPLDDLAVLDRDCLIARRNEQAHSILAPESEGEHHRKTSMLVIQRDAAGVLVERDYAWTDSGLLDRDRSQA
jgi:hypothetical protein